VDEGRRAGVIDKVVSIGMSLDTCTVPGSPKEDRIAFGKAELGLAFTAKRASSRSTIPGAQDAMRWWSKLAPAIGNGPHVALLNNLGGATPLEMAVLAEELVRSPSAIRSPWMVGPAPLMTSLDMQGFLGVAAAD
jgi:dihydroxyacetone kinase